MHSFGYVSTTGEIVLKPDGSPIGLFELQSASSIFINEATFPPQELIPNVDTADRKRWVTQPITGVSADFSLGSIAPAGLTLSFLLNDLTLQAGGGFGTGTHDADLVYVIPEPSTTALSTSALLILICRRRRHRPAPQSAAPAR
jgi:hypothetical protein